MESNLPFRVDLLDYHTAPEHFRETMDSGEVIQSTLRVYSPEEFLETLQ